jgi:hypothetical protein
MAMQNRKVAVGTVSLAWKTMTQLPSNRKSWGNRVLNCATSRVWQWKYTVY